MDFQLCGREVIAGAAGCWLDSRLRGNDGLGRSLLAQGNIALSRVHPSL